MGDKNHGQSGTLSLIADGVSGNRAEEREAQLDMLADELRPASVRLSTDKAINAEAERVRRVGRPRGSLNRSTREVRDFILRILEGLPPQARMARWLALEPEELARRWGCKVVEAVEWQRRASEGLYPYMMPKMVPVDEEGKAVPMVLVNVGNAGINGGNSSQPPWMASLEPIDDAEIVVPASPPDEDSGA